MNNNHPGLLTYINSLISSAYIIQVFATHVVKSLINSKSNNGPKLLPWVAPDKPKTSSDTTLLILTMYGRFDEYDLFHATVSYEKPIIKSFF